AYAFFQVPYVAMPSELTRDYTERTRLMTWRVVVLALAILASGGLSPALRDALGHPWGYRAVGVFVGVLILLGSVGAWWATKGVAPVEHVSASGSLRDQLRIVARARDFRALMLTYSIQALATGVMLAGVDYTARWVIESPGASTALFVAFVAPALVVTPLWERVGTRTGKRPGFTAATVCFAAGALLVWFARDHGLIAVAGAITLVGVGYAGTQMFPLAMLPDAAAVDADRTGENRVGVYTGVWTAVETLGLAFCPGVYALVRMLGGSVPSTSGVVEQPGSALTAIVLGFSVLPALLFLASLLLLRHYRIDEAAVAAAGKDLS